VSEPEAVPNQSFGETLSEVEQLGRIVQASLVALLEKFYLAKGVVGMLMLSALSSELRMNFPAIMTASGISLEGPWERISESRHVRKRRIPGAKDPDRWRRRKLRLLVSNLNKAKMFQDANAHRVSYENPRLAPDSSRIREGIPVEGLICWANTPLYVKHRPSGIPPHVYGLRVPQLETAERKVILDCLTKTADIPQTLKMGVDSVHTALLRLLDKNGIQIETTRLDLISESTTLKVGYLLACFKERRQVTKRLRAALHLFADEYKLD